ncbi:50S ribosomal protein L4p (L1e) [Chitinispirillum alkaliphilum]|nr:50S ribosomal protein L4p (L1e) [Chitinispirillum alkaliphilum]
MKAKLYQQNGTVKGEVELPNAAFASEINEPVLFQVIKSYLANQRQGTAKTKGRSEVSGGGRKPWRQKGTGRARAGSNTSPIWVRGGKAFGPEPRDYYTVIPKKLKKIALVSALSSRAKEEKVLVVDEIVCSEPKTKIMLQMLSDLTVSGKKNLLVVDVEGDKNLYLSGRNIKDLKIKPVSEINAYDIINSENVILGGEKLLGKVEEVVAL